MSKLYYTNPLVAAYMADEFGVRFINRENQELSIGEIQRDCHPKMSENDIYYIHPDSLDIFKPKIWDIVGFDGIMYGDVIGQNENIFGVQHGKSDVYMVENQIIIIQRNNKPFFMPENEE